LRANEKQARKLKKACKSVLKEILKAEQQQIDAVPPPDPTADTIEEEDDDDDEETSSPAPTFSFRVARNHPGSQSGTLQLSPCHLSCLLPHL
jgi:hypothetical protein